MPELSASQWDAFLSRYPDAHILQTSAWGELKSAFGWQPVRLAQGAVGAQVLFRRLPLGLSLAYISKGPVGGSDPASLADWESLWPEVDAVCRKQRAIFLKIEPDLWEERDEAGNPPPGFRLSSQTIQPPRTLLVDLRGDDEQILARMKQKTRYNVRLALKKGIVVQPGADLGTFHRMMLQTGERDGFGVHSLAYYSRAYDLFYPPGECELFVAFFEGQALAALMVFARGSRAWYFYGASSDAHRDRMPTYLLQWEAMRWARDRGCTQYDLWGVPDANLQTLEAQFEAYAGAHSASARGGLWGVYRFKRGFGGALQRARGPWDRVYISGLYALYNLWVRRHRGGQEAAG